MAVACAISMSATNAAGSRKRAKRFSLFKGLLGWEEERASIFGSARLGRSSSRNSRTHHRGRLVRRREAVRECHWVRVVRLADRRHLCGRSLRRRGPDEVNPRRKRAHSLHQESGAHRLESVDGAEVEKAFFLV